VTGLPGHEAMRGYLRWLAQDRGGPLVFAYVDPEHLQDIDQLYGHEVGDEVLRAFAKVLSSEAMRGTCVARVGAHEFLILTGSDRTHAETYGARVLRRLASQPVHAAGLFIPLDATIVLGELDLSQPDLEPLLHIARMLLAQSRDPGRHVLKCAWSLT
jgi:diguanylate cyclase (GGDEF)-like protein